MTEKDEKVAEEAEAPPRRKPVKKINVRIITRRGATALVDWVDGDEPRRAYVPAELVQDGQVPEDELEAGAQVGVRWEEFIKGPAATPEDYANALRRHGIYTLEDMERNLLSARQAFWECATIRLGDLIKAVRRSEK